MNTIERVAELLDPIERATTKSSLVDRSDPIERAIGTHIGQSGFSDSREQAAQREARVLAVELKAKTAAQEEVRKGSDFLEIDLGKLRQQNFLTPNSERTANGESFRRIKRHILSKIAKSKSGAPANLVLVTSTLPGEGKTFCAINLAISIALEMDRTVLLVDADVAKPSVPAALGFKAGRGLLDVLTDDAIDLSDVLCKTNIGKLTILPAGTPNQHATELLASDAMRELLLEMADRYHDRIIIFDSPPLLAASEATVLANQMGQVIMVVEAEKTPEGALKSALGRIEASNISGLLLNKGEDPGLRYHYGEYS
jgi:protein-tyrosine kinase